MDVISAGLYVLNYIGITTLLVFFCTFMILVLTTRRDKGVPPGPPLVPVLGNLVSLASKDSLTNLDRLRQKYGDIYSLYVGSELTIFLNGYDVIYDALLRKGSMFANRPDNPFTKIVCIYPGIVAANGHLWKQQRVFSQRALDLLCFKNKSRHVEEIILMEAAKLLQKLETLNQPTEPRHYLQLSITNVMASVLISKSFALDDAEITAFLDHVHSNAKFLPRLMTLLNCFPFLAKLPVDVLGVEKVVSAVWHWLSLFNKYVLDRHFEGEKNDFIELYMQTISENEARGTLQTLTKVQMPITTYDLIIAGSDTTATTISWLLLYILHDNELETRLHSEIDDIIGRHRAPSLDDRCNMPYTEATILECLRISTVAPLGVPHSVPRDVIFRGYLIPKNATVITNLNSIMMDPKTWPEPEIFLPERFLSNDRKTVDIPKQFMPFSLGPRSCLGETLAKMEIFLYLTSILQRFRLSPSGPDLPPVKGSLGIVYNPDPYQIQFVKR